MATKYTAQFVAMVNDQPRALFSVLEATSGDLRVILKSGGLIGDKEIRPTAIVPVLQDRFSIHRSLESPTGINQIKYTFTAEGRRNEPTSHFTRAIKQTNRFAPLLAARASNLSGTPYDPAPATLQVSLGKYPAGMATMFYSIWVAARDRVFAEPPKGARTRVIQHAFQSFRLVVMTGTVFLPANGHTVRQIAKTFAPETAVASVAEQTQELADGYDEPGAILVNEQRRRYLFDHYADFIQREEPGVRGAIPNARLLGFGSFI